MPGMIYVDNDGHQTRTAGTALTAAANGTTAAGTIVPVNAGAGTGSAVSFTAGTQADDNAGVFELTAAGTPAAGVVAHVYFAKPYPRVPTITVDCYNHTDQTATATMQAANVTAAGFDVVSTVLVAAKVYRVSYRVDPFPVTA